MASLYKRPNSPYWWVYYRAGQTVRESTGIRHNGRSRPCPLAAEALRRIEDKLARARFGLAPVVEPKTLSEFFTEHLAALTVADATKRTLASTFATVERWASSKGLRLVSDITRPKVLDYLAARRAEGISDTTLKTSTSVLASAWRAARASRYCEFEEDANPWQVPIKAKPAEKIPFSDDELAKLFSAPGPEWIHIGMRIALSTGCRIGSMLALDWADVCLADGIIRFRRSKTGSYVVPMTRELADYLRKHEKPMGHVLEEPAERGWESFASREFGDFCEKVIGRRANWHHFRHTWVTRMQSRGVPMRITMELANHASEAVHRGYAHTKALDLRPYVESVTMFPVTTLVA